jgi:starch phosphorylase
MTVTSLAQKAVQEKDLNWIGLLEQEPDAGLGNGGLGRLAACFLDSMATMQLPGMGYGLRYEYGMFRQTIANGWQSEQPDNWLRDPDPWEVARPHEAVEIKLNCSFDLRGGSLCAIPNKPSRFIGIPFDRPVIGYGGKTINTLRLWAAATSNEFDFQEFSRGDFAGALSEQLSAESVTRVLYPRRVRARGCVFCKNTSWSHAHRPTSCGASETAIAIGKRCRTKLLCSSTTRIPRWLFPS